MHNHLSPAEMRRNAAQVRNRPGWRSDELLTSTTCIGPIDPDGDGLTDNPSHKFRRSMGYLRPYVQGMRVFYAVKPAAGFHDRCFVHASGPQTMQPSIPHLPACEPLRRVSVIGRPRKIYLRRGCIVALPAARIRSPCLLSCLAIKL